MYLLRERFFESNAYATSSECNVQMNVVKVHLLTQNLTQCQLTPVPTAPVLTYSKTSAFFWVCCVYMCIT